MKRISEKKMKWLLQQKIYMLKVVPKLSEVTRKWQHTYEIWNDRDGIKQAEMPYCHCDQSS